MSVLIDICRLSTYIDSMSTEQELTEVAGGRDPADGLRAVRALRELADRLEMLQVHNARDQGWSWQDIARYMGVSRQAVHKKYAQGNRLFGRGK